MACFREECKEYEDGFWHWMEGLGTGVKRDNPSTWKHPAWPPSYRGIINSLEVAHQAFVWKVRKNPRLLKVEPLIHFNATHTGQVALRC